MTNKPEVSIVIPVYNEELNLPELVKRCVAACDKLPQSYEILLVDDGSRDRSAELIEQAVKDHPGHKAKGKWGIAKERRILARLADPEPPDGQLLLGGDIMEAHDAGAQRPRQGNTPSLSQGAAHERQDIDLAPDGGIGEKTLRIAVGGAIRHSSA